MQKTILFIVTLGWLANVWAGPFDPILSNAWIGETVPGQTTATLQINITTVKAVKLLSLSSPAADKIEIHNLTMHKGAMKVNVVPNFHIKNHQNTKFGSQGFFLMLMGINQPLKVGDKIPVSAVFEFADKKTKSISAIAEVRKTELSYKNFGQKGIYEEYR